MSLPEANSLINPWRIIPLIGKMNGKNIGKTCGK
jgi:hypothetical protein